MVSNVCIYASICLFIYVEDYKLLLFTLSRTHTVTIMFCHGLCELFLYLFHVLMFMFMFLHFLIVTSVCLCVVNNSLR